MVEALYELSALAPVKAPPPRRSSPYKCGFKPMLILFVGYRKLG